MTDTDIQFTDTDISVSAKYIGRYIGQPIYRSNPNVNKYFVNKQNVSHQLTIIADILSIFSKPNRLSENYNSMNIKKQNNGTLTD